MRKKILASFVVASMILGLTACGSKSNNNTKTSTNTGKNKTESSSTDTGSKNTGSKDTGSKDTGSTDSSTPAAGQTSELEPVTLKMYFNGSDVTDDSAVLEKANEYLKEKINVTLEPIWGTWGDFDTNSVLALQGADDVDIYFTCSWSADEYNKFARDGYWLRLDNPDSNLIEQYAPELWTLLPEVLRNGATINGSDGYGVYAVPGYKDIATQNCWDINVPLLEKYGYTIEDIQSRDYYSFGDLLKTVKEGEGDSFYPLIIEGFVLERMADSTIIVTGDSGTGNFMSYYLNPEDVSQANSAYGNKIVNKFATEEFKRFAEQTREYYEAGYIDPGFSNANQANDLRSSLQLTGGYLIGTQSYALGYELQASQERGFEVAMVPCTDAYVDTTSSQGAMMAISTVCKKPERAMMFLNLLNTDSYLMTLLNYGVEGIHYELKDGLVNFLDKRADYRPWTNGVGNVTILTPTVDQGADFWNGFKAYYGTAKEIPILGFSFDSSSVSTEMGSVANVVAEYGLALSTGSVDPDEKLPEFIKKLEDNGINTVLEEANRQLDEFMAAKQQ